MKHKSTRIALRWFFRLEVVCLCVTLAGVGVCVAAERTAYTAQGAPAAVQTDTPVQSVVSRLPDRQTVAALAAYGPLLPAPVGSLFAIYLSAKNIAKKVDPEAFGILHNFLR